MEKKNTAFSWHRLLRTMVAMLVIMSMLLCGCAEANVDDQDDKDDNKKPNTGLVLGDGDGKLEPQDAVDSFTAIYGNLLSAVGGNAQTGYGSKMDMTVTLGQELLEGMQQSFEQAGWDIEMDWLQKIGMSMEVAYDGDRMQMDAGASLNGKSILTMDMILDMMGNKMYVGLPELSEQYLAGPVDLSEMQNVYQDMQQQMEKYADVVSSLPTDKELNTLLGRYLELALKALKDPTTADVTLSYESISQNVTATTYTICRSDVLNIASAVLTTAQTDADLEKMIDTFGTWYNAKAAQAAKENGTQWTDIDLHAQLLAGMEEALINIEDTRENLEDAEFLSFIVYTSGEEQVGFRLTMSDGYETMGMYGYSLTDGSDTAFVMDLAGAMQFAGVGTVKSGKISGNYTLTANGMEMLHIELDKFDTEALKQGDLKGTVRLRLSQAVLDNMDSNPLFNDQTVIELVLDVTSKRASMAMNLYYGDTFAFGVEFTSKTVSVTKIQIPNRTVDPEDTEAVQAWAQGLKLDKILDNLREAGVPEELMDALEEAVQGGVSGQPSVGYAAQDTEN